MLISGPQQFTPVIVRVVHAPTKEISVVDLILGGLGITGLILLGALVLGGLLGGLFIWFKHRRPENPFNGQASQTHGLHLTAASFGALDKPQPPADLPARELASRQ